MREVYGETREQRCWFHKTGNVLNKMPKKRFLEIDFKNCLCQAQTAKSQEHFADDANKVVVRWPTFVLRANAQVGRRRSTSATTGDALSSALS